jgi:hypothetical protein
VKAENVLLGPDGRWLLCDFGSACGRHGVLESVRDIAMEEEVVRKYTTPAYRAPEVRSAQGWLADLVFDCGTRCGGWQGFCTASARAPLSDCRPLLPLPLPSVPLLALQLYDLYAREYLGPPVDVWALGVLLYLLAYGRLPFEGEAKLQVLNGRVPAPPEAEAAGRPPQLAALVRDMLTVSPRLRPTIQQVLARLRGMAPPELWQLGEEGQGHGVQQAGPTAPPLHELVPSQGWADFASDGSGAASLGRNGSGGGSSTGNGSFTRRQSGSGSWATFSPTKGGEGVGLAAVPATAAAGVGSCWSSFGEEVPLAEAQPAQAQPEEAPEPQQAQQQQAQQEQTEQQQAQAQAAARRQPVTPPQQLPVAPWQQAAPAAATVAAPPLIEPAEVSPLSAGLAHMSQHSFSAAASSVSKPPERPAPAAPTGPSTGGERVPEVSQS